MQYIYCKIYVFRCSSSKLQTLLHALSPAVLRVGGSGADWLFFDKPLSVLQAAGLQPDVAVATSMQLLTVTNLLFFLC